MRSLLCGAMAVGMILCAAAMPAATTVQKKKTSPRPAARRPAGAASTHSATRRTGKKATSARTTWRNRQLAPTPERYKEIQQALVAKGYLKPEDATGGWDQNSLDALKKFQADQNIDSTGKINSLSLIALGLGPKRDTASAKPVTEPAQTDR